MGAVCGGLLWVAFIAADEDSGACFTDLGAFDQMDCEDICFILLLFLYFKFIHESVDYFSFFKKLKSLCLYVKI